MLTEVRKTVPLFPQTAAYVGEFIIGLTVYLTSKKGKKYIYVDTLQWSLDRQCS